MSFSFKFDLQCDENNWKLSFVGTIHNIGVFINVLLSGYFSDKFGRKAILVFSVFISGSFGLLKSFAWSYLSFIIIEIIDTILAAGMYTAVFVLGNFFLNKKLYSIDIN